MIVRPSDVAAVEHASEVRPARGLVWLRLDPVSLAVSSLMGVPEELLGEPSDAWNAPGFLTDRVDPRDLDKVQEVLAKAKDLTEPAVAEFRMLHAEGHPVWVQLCCLGQSTPDGDIQVSLLNIDEQVLVERALSEAVETMRDALVTTSQEIAQPANAISDYGSMLERHLSTQSDHVGSDYALGIREAVERLKQLSNTLQRVGRRARVPHAGGGR